jgi:putative DNA primase/helicase
MRAAPRPAHAYGLTSRAAADAPSASARMTSLHDVADQMRAALPDDPAADLVPDGKRRYWGRQKKNWYVLRELRTHGGATVVVGAFGTYRHGGAWWRVDVDWQGISAEERERMAAQRRERAERERAERAREAARAKRTAAQQWREASPSGHSPYLERKGVQGEACRYLPDGSILVPLLRYDLPRERALQALQRIYPGPRGTDAHGEPLPQKVFTRGFAKPGCSVRLGMVTVGQPVLVCEGYATGLTLRMATARRVPVFVALDAGNLQPVCDLLAELHPTCPLLVCADDDWLTQDAARRRLVNPGVRSARHAAATVARERLLAAGVHVVYPVWPARGPGIRHDCDTDFNDLAARAGLDAVRVQIARALRCIAPPEPAAEPQATAPPSTPTPHAA